MRKIIVLASIIVLFASHAQSTLWQSYVFYHIDSVYQLGAYNYVLYPELDIRLLGGSSYEDYIMDNLGVEINDFESDDGTRMFLSIKNEHLSEMEKQRTLANFFINLDYEKLALKIGRNDWEVFTMKDIHVPFFLPIYSNYPFLGTDIIDDFVEKAQVWSAIVKEKLDAEDIFYDDNSLDNEDKNPVFSSGNNVSHSLFYVSIGLNILLITAITAFVLRWKVDL